MKLIILDRDGVINHDSADYIKSNDEWQPIKGSLEAIAKLSQAGYDIVIMTNQSAIGRKLITADTLGQIHVRMIDYIRQHGGKIQSILFCPHHPDQDCDCRKPKIGMYRELSERINVSFAGVYSVGDSMRDLIAADRAGAQPVLVQTGNGKATEADLTSSKHSFQQEIPIYADLAAFTDALLLKEMEQL